MADNNCDTGLCSLSEDPLDVKTFTPPVRVNKGASPTPSIIIEVNGSERTIFGQF